jgi:NADH-quinone oxidoreductase subunit C
MSTTIEALADDLSAKFGQAIKSKIVDKKIVKIEVGREDITAVAKYLRDNMGWDHVKAVTAIDLSRATKKEDRLEVIYHLGTYSRADCWGLDLAISCRVEKASPRMTSLTDIWPSCEFHEREAFEMFGIVFENHPNLKRLLLPDYWSDIPPLLKDYQPPGR